MLLSGGILEIKDIDGNVVSGVTGNYFYMFSATFIRHGQVINLPSQAVGKKGLLIVKTTVITGHHNAMFAYLNGCWVVAPEAAHRPTGEVYKYTYTLNSIPQIFALNEENGNLRDVYGAYRVEIKIYY